MIKEQQAAERAAIQAGDYIQSCFSRLTKDQISEKRENDYVTDVDKRSEEMIRQYIQERFPHDDILGEEGGGKRTQGNRCWVIDPIDGTLNFIQGIPFFAVSIGLVSSEGDPVVGVVYAPLQGELFSAKKDSGAFLNGKPITSSKTKEPSKSVFATGFHYGNRGDFLRSSKAFESVVKGSSGIRLLGCASLHLAYAACGRLDGFWESGLSIWDVAGGSTIVRESGGRVSDYSYQNSFLESGEIVAANMYVHSWLLRAVAQHFV